MTLPELLPLARSLEEDSRVVVLVGAGVSIGATAAPHASWLGLLKHGVNHLVATDVFTAQHGDHLRASLDAAFDPFDLERALGHAELIEQNLKEPAASAFSGWLRAAFEELSTREGGDDGLKALAALQQAGALLVTTNYDSLLADATDLPPITWDQHDAVLALIRRERDGILHIHGHWQNPSSVVLGRGSYERIARDEDFQTVLRSLWLQWSWLYVGCGDGIGDPNLGRLREWGKRWRKTSPPDYFLFRLNDAGPQTESPDGHQNLVRVGYQGHEKLPGILRGVSPAARCWPFVPVDEDFGHFRPSGSSREVPSPSRQEYMEAAVPALAADATVRARLDQHGWAFVLDSASVGKTTLALRLATSGDQQRRSTYYLDLKTLGASEPDLDVEASLALRRLSRAHSLLVVDNVHHRPELGHQLWDAWRERRRGSNLLLIATRTQRAMPTTALQDLGFFEHHATNPAVGLRPTPDDLEAIARHVQDRVGGTKRRPMPAVPPSVLLDWHRDYGSALEAFCLAVLGHVDALRQGQWELPPQAASDLVRERWISPLDTESLENLLCLSVFGAQELEIEVVGDALPHPDRVERLMRLGLVEMTRRGQEGQIKSFSLREPGWGRLVLAAHPLAQSEESVLFATSARHPVLALALVSRLRRTGRTETAKRFWAHLVAAPPELLAHVPHLPLHYCATLVAVADREGHRLLASQVLDATMRDLGRLAARAWETPLQHVASLLASAKAQGRNTSLLWEALERKPNRFATRALDTSLQHVASFLATARAQGRDTSSLWGALERKPNRLAKRALDTSLEHVASFLAAAKGQGRDTSSLWEALERKPNRLAKRALDTSLEHVASFLTTANAHGRDTSPLWEALERKPNRLAKRACDTALEHVAAFLHTARRHERKVATAAIWTALERRPRSLAERALSTSLEHLSALFDAAKSHSRSLVTLVRALEAQPDALAESGRSSTMASLAGFCHHAPESLIRIVLSRQDSLRWRGTPAAESLQGATWVAAKCRAAGRPDLEEEFVTLLLRRATENDFPPRGATLANMVWMLSHVPAGAVSLVPAFLDAVCTPSWLGRLYTRTETGVLAKGLRVLALRLPPDLQSRLEDASLPRRVWVELATFNHSTQDQQSQIIQLVGSASLLGVQPKPSWFATVSMSTVAALPAEECTHRVDADWVEAWNWQLWVGLRAVVSCSRRILAVPMPVVAETLRLWRANLKHSAEAGAASTTRLDEAMVAWLELCVQRGIGLVPA